MKKSLFFLSVIISTCIYSQNDATRFDDLVKKDSSIVPSLFSYSDSVYNSILVASTHPQVIVKLNEIQKTSSDSFKKLISTFNQKRQKELWEIIRYPLMTSILIENKNTPEKELNEKLKEYPRKIKSSALYFQKKSFSTLVEIEKIHQDFETKYKELIKDYPNDIKKAYNLLLGHPEIITTLSEDMKTTSALGELYTRSPVLIKQKADSLNLEIAKERGIEYEDWKQGINNDTAMQKELKDVAKNYSQEESYDDDIYASPNDKRNISIVYSVAPYPYWAGYPYWYGRDYWYPYPWWYQTGFYWPLFGPLQFYGLPRYSFGWWYYNQPHHYYNQHPHANDYFYNHYHGRRNFNSGFNRSTNEFFRGQRK